MSGDADPTPFRHAEAATDDRRQSSKPGFEPGSEDNLTAALDFRQKIEHLENKSGDDRDGNSRKVHRHAL
ncbi:hypothetical protein [Rhizobium sp. Leaf371]|uniref:hypothetical protein n=1 Tax=Rhizobium sp. Leaf371 TaxID=1736355 RepID=UPI0012E942F3|nr:hypothetical protein [Rhizobium sp. Leaf371]